MYSMKETGDCKPNVLCFSGLDPTGGAGIQADIEALFSAGCHCLPVVTALTVQDTHNVMASHPVAPTLLIAQARAVLDDMPVAAIKIGLLGSIQAAEALHSILLCPYASIFKLPNCLPRERVVAQLNDAHALILFVVFILHLIVCLVL